ncbi:MAG: hypothetical protein WCC87_10815 [Candidatus Korobacteraceae bacterium]
MCTNILLTAVLFLAPAMLRADVADSAANGFTVKIVENIHAAPADVYNRLVHNVGDWWSSDHTFSGDAHNLSIDEKPMGCFCEKLANGGAVRHAEVIFYAPAKALVLSGVFGPLQKLGAAGTLSFAITPVGDGSKLEVTFAIGGYAPGGLNTWAAPVDSVLTEQVTRLKSYIETGAPGVAGGAKKQ